MALAKAEKKKLIDQVKEDGMWKKMIDTEDKSESTWKENWGWIMDEYQRLHEKLREKSEASEFLHAIQKEQEPDRRKIRYFPDTTNHEYGWLASHKEFNVNKVPDVFVPLPLPEIYHIFKEQE